ncbi:MAG TPA: nucleotidyltransferase family protein [Acidimicrobiales bacterium]|nr:nucleotidyltransferase family protein [Acidimicrobiales bacterium]
MTSPGSPSQAGVVAHNLAIEAELARASQALQDAGVDHVVLKGVTLMRRLGVPISTRRVADNDLLVRGGDVGRAVAALARAGWEPTLPAPRGRRQREEKELCLVARRAGVGLSLVDLHWHAADPLLYGLDEGTVWAHTELVEAPGGGTYRVLDGTLATVALAAHWAQHGMGTDWTLERLAQAWNLWGGPRVLVLARESGLGATLAYGLGVARSRGLLDRPPPPPGPARARLLARWAPQGLSRTRHSEYGNALLAAALAGPTRATGWSMARAFPPMESLAAIYRRPTSAWLYLTYLTRPLRPLRRLKDGSGRLVPTRPEPR